MNNKLIKSKNQVKVEDLSLKVLSKEQISKNAEIISKQLHAYTWRDLETNGKFCKNDKISILTEDTLIVGCDIGSESHYIRAIDSRGIELSKNAYCFNNNEEGFGKAKEWILKLAAQHDKKQVVLGLEPTGHYWFAIAMWMISNGISVVQVNPYAVKQSKEIEDNSQKKDDKKDPKVIANLVKDGNYGVPYIPDGIYAELRNLSGFREQLVEDRIRAVNRLHREMTVYFPEYKDAFGKIDGTFAIEVLKTAPLPEDIVKLEEKGLCAIWHEAKLRGRGYSRAKKIVDYAKSSIGLKEGTYGAREKIKWCISQIIVFDEKIRETEEKIHEYCRKLPFVDNILEIKGIGEVTLAGIISEMGDISRFDDVREIQKLSGLNLVDCSSGKHKGQTKISYRGRKRLRYWLFQAAKSAVAHGYEYKLLHKYYTTREDNPLKKMQSLIVIACKILRVIFSMLTKGTKYDPEKMLGDIKRPCSKVAQTVA